MGLHREFCNGRETIIDSKGLKNEGVQGTRRVMAVYSFHIKGARYRRFSFLRGGEAYKHFLFGEEKCGDQIRGFSVT